ncbi:MAG: glycosyltransferase family 4 protein [Alphaproteobacteria bacterium]|nr:glycosyltransferase family 4 protein [Alphaproteobacteria bacterium]
MATLHINGRFVTQRQTGVQRFALETVRAIDKLLGDSEFAAQWDRAVFWVPPGAQAPDFARIETRMASRFFKAGYGWEQIDLPLACRGGVLLSLCNLGPVAKRDQVVVVHDATPWVSPPSVRFAFRAAYKTLVPALGRIAKRIVAISDFSRREISHWYGIPRDRISLCSEGADHILVQAADTAPLARNGLIDTPYFLAVGVGSPNKNIDLVLAAFERADLPAGTKLVLTGKRDARVHPAGDIRESDRVAHLGFVSDGELRALYEGALALVYPSRYEGFGLPPVEAMACGCPVVISDQEALLETSGSGDAALICGMDDADGLAAILAKLARDAGLRQDLSSRGREHVKRFQWARTAQALLGYCREAAS